MFRFCFDFSPSHESIDSTILNIIEHECSVAVSYRIFSARLLQEKNDGDVDVSRGCQWPQAETLFLACLEEAASLIPFTMGKIL